MSKIIEYINDNAIVASLITLFLSTIIQIIFRKNDRKYNDEKDRKKESKREYENKAELLIDNNIEDDGTIPCINLFMSDFEVKVSKDKQDVMFYYSKDILKSKKYKHLTFYMKNIGNADINQLDICVTNQRYHMICHLDNLENIVKDNFVNYNYCYDRKILKGRIIKIDIAYLKDSKIFGFATSELALLFKDSYNNLYEQPFFVQRKNLYEPYKITNKKYRLFINPDVAIECFKNPWLW